MAKGFPIPPKAEIKPEEVKTNGADIVKAITADDDTNAGVFSLIETDDNGEFVAELTEEELDAYAKGVLAGDEDVRGLQVGMTFGSFQEAADEADKLNKEFAPADDSDESKADAIVDARAAAFDVPDVGMEEEAPPEDEFGELGNEPMLDQFGGY